ncbi:MAG: hypothetical protein MUF72_09280 [Elainella sp. Prado103]|nr:hypothetical protein [Elainella sp. Prado103]
MEPVSLQTSPDLSAHPLPQVVYEHLDHIDQEDVADSAVCREQAQEILADPEVSLSWREAIADRLRQVNLLLAKRTVSGGDSY